MLADESKSLSEHSAEANAPAAFLYLYSAGKPRRLDGRPVIYLRPTLVIDSLVLLESLNFVWKGVAWRSKWVGRRRRMGRRGVVAGTSGTRRGQWPRSAAAASAAFPALDRTCRLAGGLLLYY